MHNTQAQNLIDYFAHKFDKNVTEGYKLDYIEENYRNKYPTNFTCEDGHRVRSLSEQTIDNWLFRRGIPHGYEPVVPIPQQLIPDFMVKDIDGKIVYIEFWGKPDEPSYRERMVRKSKIYAENNFLLIELRPPDLKDLDFIMQKKLKQKNVQL